jgi:predicted Zn-dependent protease
MSNTLLVRSLIATFVLLVVSSIHAQECAPPVITANTRNYNIFSPEQEIVLGDLNYQRMSGELRFINDHALQAYITALGQKLVKHLPPTGLRFQFYIVDMPEANAFNTPGGFVFVSRKLIGFVNNEDELAGVHGA